MPVIKTLGGKIIASGLTNVVPGAVTRPLHPDVVTYNNNVTAAGGTVSASEISALDNFVWALHENNLKSRILHFYPLLGTTAASQKISLYGSTIAFTSVAACHTSKGFSQLGVGTNYGNTNVSNVYAQSSGTGGCQVYISQTGITNANEGVFWSTITGGMGYGISLYSTTLFYTDYYNDVAWTVNGLGTNKLGNWMFTRISPTTLITKDKVNGKVSRTYSQASGFTQSVSYGSTICLGNPHFSYASSTIGCASLLSGMTSAELDIYDSLIMNLMSQLGR